MPKKHEFQHLKEWCPDHLWAPSCYHETLLEKAFTKLLRKVLSKKFHEKRFAIGQGWEVVERYIEGQNGNNYAKTDTIPVVVIDEEKEKALKTCYITLYTKFFHTHRLRT
ncbi:MAG: hypothetical protein QMD22_08495 [archaeon]|nr:hypothetical protein [archaeon]